MTVPAYDPKKKVMNGVDYQRADGKWFNAKGIPTAAPKAPEPVWTGPTTTGVATGKGTYGNGVAFGGSNPAYDPKYAAPKTSEVTTASPNMPSEVTAASPNTPPLVYQDPYKRSDTDIASLAKNRIDAILGAGRTSAAGALKGAKTAYDYTNQIEGDQRSLRNFEFKNRNDPFSGQTGYVASQMLRGDAIDDTFQDSEYNNQVGLINQKLADLEAAAPGQEQAIIDQLQQIERSTGISVAQLQEQQKNNQFNQFNQNREYDRNVSNDQYDQSPTNPVNIGRNLSNQLAQYQLDDYPEQSKAAATKLQQEIDKGKLDNDTAQWNFDQLKDPKSPINMANKYDAEIKRLELETLPEMQKQELAKIKKQIQDIGTVHYKPQTQAEKDYDLQQVDKIKAEIDKIKGETTGKTLKGTPVNAKASSDAYGIIIGDLEEASNLAEAYALIEQNVDNLTDADYKAAKAEARKIFN